MGKREWWDKGTQSPYVPKNPKKTNKLKLWNVYRYVVTKVVDEKAWVVCDVSMYRVEYNTPLPYGYPVLIASYATKEEAEAMRKLLTAVNTGEQHDSE